MRVCRLSPKFQNILALHYSHIAILLLSFGVSASRETDFKVALCKMYFPFVVHGIRPQPLLVAFPEPCSFKCMLLTVTLCLRLSGSVASACAPCRCLKSPSTCPAATSSAEPAGKGEYTVTHAHYSLNFPSGAAGSILHLGTLKASLF